MAASISIAWALVGLATNHFGGGVDEYLRPARERARSAFGVMCGADRVCVCVCERTYICKVGHISLFVCACACGYTHV